MLYTCSCVYLCVLVYGCLFPLFSCLRSHSLKLSNFLVTTCGVSLESRVGVLLPNCVEVMELHYAGAATNATMLNLNTHLVAREMAYILTDARPVVVFASIAYAATLEEALRVVIDEHELGRGQRLSVRGVVWVVLSTSSGGIEVAGPTPDQTQTSSRGASTPQQAQDLAITEEAMRRIHGLGLKQYSYHSIISKTVEFDFEPRVCLPRDPFQMYYTSGTTGRPKGVVLSHSVVTLHAAGAIAEHRLNERDTWGHFAPMFHLVDAFAIFAITLVGGRHVILRQWDTAKALAAIERERVSVTNVASTMLTLMASNPLITSTDLSSLRLLSAGGSPTPFHFSRA